MKKYFYTDGTDKFGPFSFEELKELNLSKDTLVWYEGMDEWKACGSIPELRGLFSQNTPPPPPSNQAYQNATGTGFNNLSQSPPKTWLVESILVTILCCLPFGIAGIVNASKVESRFYAGDFIGAEKASADAKKWVITALICGVVVIALYLIFVFVIGLGSYYNGLF